MYKGGDSQALDVVHSKVVGVGVGTTGPRVDVAGGVAQLPPVDAVNATASATATGSNKCFSRLKKVS